MKMRSPRLLPPVMKMLLKPVSSSLETGYTSSLYKYLEIMQQHGIDAARHLSGEILDEVRSDEGKKLYGEWLRDYWS